MLDNPSLWQDFKNQIAGGSAVAPPEVITDWKATGTATCTGNSARVRSTPELGNNILCQLDNGNRFEINGEKQSGWVKVKVVGDIGWMSEQYVKYDQTDSENSKPTGSKIAEDGQCGEATTLRLQEVFGTPIDGKISNQLSCYRHLCPGILSAEWSDVKNGGSALIKSMQKWLEVPDNKRDRYIEPDFIIRLGRKMGTPVDGELSNPSAAIKALQHWCNQQ